MRTWENKIQDVIGKLCYASYKQANYNKQGIKYKKHRPYSIPEEAQVLVKCLGMHDRRKAEISAKECMEELRLRRVPID